MASTWWREKRRSGIPSTPLPNSTISRNVSGYGRWIYVNETPGKSGPPRVQGLDQASDVAGMRVLWPVILFTGTIVTAKKVLHHIFEAQSLRHRERQS